MKKKRRHVKAVTTGANGHLLDTWRPTADHRAQLARALELQRNGENHQAEALYQKILDQDPRHPDALHLSGMLCARQGDYTRAIALIRMAIQSYPKSDILYNNLANVLIHAGQLEEALDAYRKAVEINPRCFDAYNNLGNTSERLGKPLEAIGYFQKALEIRPDSAEAHSNMGNVLAMMGRVNEAIPCLEKSIELNSASAEAYNNIGNVLKAQEKYAEAIDYYCKAIETDPQYADAFNNIGATITEMGKPDEAVKFFQKALEIKPSEGTFLVNLYDALKRTCDWSQIDRINKEIDMHTRKALDAGQRPFEDPFLSLERHDDPALNYAVAKSWSRAISQRMSEVVTNFNFNDRREGIKRITLGYLSNNFRNHALGHLIAGLFGRHDRNRFKVNAYSTGEDDQSKYRKRIEKDCDRFVDIRMLHHQEAAQEIYNDKVDILIDLMGFTKGARMEIAAFRPAPVQIRYMGMAGTTGSDFFDYLIADRIVVPEPDTRYYSEKLAYLPDCYQVNDYQQIELGVALDRKSVGLPEDAFVFCSFNQNLKLDPIMFDAWMEILQGVPGSVLWLQAGSKIGEQHLLREAHGHGITKERIVFGGKMEKADHLARLQLADLVLDTRLVNGAATTSDALWARVPVITLQGRHFSSRMSASILRAIGLDDLITSSIKEYIDQSVCLASNPSEIDAIRRRLCENIQTKPLFDTKRVVANLETAYREMWHIFNSNQSPRLIKVGR